MRLRWLLLLLPVAKAGNTKAAAVLSKSGTGTAVCIEVLLLLRLLLLRRLCLLSGISGVRTLRRSPPTRMSLCQLDGTLARGAA